MILSFMKSWTHADVARIVEVVVVQVAIRVHIPHVVIVVSRTQPETLKDQRESILALPILFIFK